ncbi:MAG TPA: magnesium-translocating P-type ATPase [Spongiibacteraceae bacterium]|nr:magnesium-translocating P-type ATPase [Spongiibacteraceae bacterium]
MNVLQHLFATFLRTRRATRHFRRRAILDLLRPHGGVRQISPTMTRELRHAAHASTAELLADLHSHSEGLTGEQAEKKRKHCGPNEIEQEKPLPWWAHLWLCYKNPFNLLLTTLALISFYTNDSEAAIVITSMVVLSTLLRFIQEARSNRAAEQLKAMVSNTATVIRRIPVEASAAEIATTGEPTYRSTRIEQPIKLLVPGDIVHLSAGDMIPADLRLINTKDLFVGQSALTGESLPIEKFATLNKVDTHNPFELDNIVFMGTNIISGAATAVVVHTGNRTYFGALAERVSSSDRTPTAFQSGVNKISWLLIRFMLVMAPLVFLINGFTKHDWLEAFLFALSIAVGLTPEMLPMIVTSTLAKGAVMLSRKKVIVKRLDAIQNFGAMDILCTDKTGTLTQDKIFLERHTDVYGETADDVLECAYLNSYYQTGLKNLLDHAVLEHVEIHRELAVNVNFRKIDEIPFDFQRRRMSVVVAERDDHHELICKGAVEEILTCCTHVKHRDIIDPLDTATLERVRQVTSTLNEEGLRVVAVAMKELPPTQTTYSVADECGLTLIGYIAFLDPPKESTEHALRALKAHGVDVKILTGDNELVTAKICREVGVEITGIKLGFDIESLNDAELAAVVESTNIFAKLTPAHKERIVRSLRNNGHVVGFMGDGINDAPALRGADIGISVDSAVDIAKEAADIILLEKSLMVLEEGVIEGRKTFSNMLKYIKMTASSNFGNVFSVLIASAFLPFLPMLPLQLLVQNLLYDISQIAIPFDNVDNELLQKPQHWNPDNIGRFMLFFGPISSIFDITTFAILWYVLGANSPAQQTLFQSGWFAEGLISQTLIVHMIRTRRIAFIQSRAALPLLITTAIIMAVGIFLPMGPLAEYFKMQALPIVYFPLLLVIVLAYMTLTQIMKEWYAKRFGWQ